MAKIERTLQQRIIQAIESVLNTEIPGTPRISGLKVAQGEDGRPMLTSGRVMYVALPGSGNKSRNVLSHRAQQVLAVINRKQRATSKALQAALNVNRNVIAGAVHELKQLKLVRTEPVLVGGQAFDVAHEFQPRRAKAAKANGRRKNRK
jgi:hypothetical protein